MQSSNQGLFPQQSYNSSPMQYATNWNELYLKTELVKGATQLGYQLPSRIQVMAIPKILQGHNLICQAKAGTGKSAVFILGVLHRIAS